MRAEFIVNTGWRQIEDCADCHRPVFTYQVKQAKRLNLNDTETYKMCTKCSMEELQLRQMYKEYQRTRDGSLVSKIHEILSRED